MALIPCYECSKGRSSFRDSMTHISTSEETPSAKLTTDRGGIFKALRVENIGVNVHYIPVSWHPYYRSLGFDPGSWPVAEAHYERSLSLPMWPGMSDGGVQDVIRAVDKVLLAYS